MRKYLFYFLFIIFPIQNTYAMDPSFDEEVKSIHKINKHSQKNVETQHKKERQYNLRGVSLCSGNDPDSHIIKQITRSEFSHVGIILSDVEDERVWYCFELTGSVAASFHGEYPRVRIASWKDIVETYDGTISYRLFIFDEGKDVSSKKIINFVENNRHVSYTINPLKLIKCCLGIDEQPPSECLETSFCSELVANMLMVLNVLQAGTPGNFLPKHFSNKSESEILLKDGIELTPEFREK